MRPDQSHTKTMRQSTSKSKNDNTDYKDPRQLSLFGDLIIASDENRFIKSIDRNQNNDMENKSNKSDYKK